MKHRLRIIVLLGITVCACGKNTSVICSQPWRFEDSLSFFIRNGPVEINLDNMETGKQFEFDSLFSGWEYVKNKEGENFRLSPFSGQLFDGNKNFFVIDMFRQTVNLYDIQGNHVHAVGKVGKHPDRGEYLYMNSIAFDPKNKFICILSSRQGKIFKYTYDNRFLGTIPVNVRHSQRIDKADKRSAGRICDKIALTPEGNLLIHYAYWDGNKAPYNYVLTDTEGNILSKKKTFRPFDGYTDFRSELNNYTYKKRLHVKDNSDTLYFISGNNFIPKYVFKSKHSLKWLVENAGGRIAVHHHPLGNKVKEVVGLKETKKYLFFSYRLLSDKMSQRTYCYLDKRDGKVYKMPEVKMPYAAAPDSLPVKGFRIYKEFGNCTYTGSKEGIIKLYLK